MPAIYDARISLQTEKASTILASLSKGCRHEPRPIRPPGPNHQLLGRGQFDPQHRADDRNASRHNLPLTGRGRGGLRELDEQMRELSCRRIEVDEIWAYVAKKQRHLMPLDDPRRVGDQYTFVALDPETKIVPAYRVGKRDLPTATAFITDLSERLANRIQLSSDALAAYVEATEQAFGADIDYGQVVKFYEAEPVARGRYSPPHVVGAQRSVIAGDPDPAHISTSLIERQNLTMRMSMRRFTRLTNAFSKKVENLRAAVSLHFAHYNFVRVHRTLRVTPAMEARVTDRLWSLDELVEQTSQ
jgi:IS1 family transposase